MGAYVEAQTERVRSLMEQRKLETLSLDLNICIYYVVSALSFSDKSEVGDLVFVYENHS
jgi:hypothetical protein